MMRPDRSPGDKRPTDDDAVAHPRNVLRQPDFALEGSRRSWLSVLAAVVLVHVVLITAIVVVTRNRRAGDAIRDVPVVRGVPGDTSGRAGTGFMMNTGHLEVFCTYVLGENAIATLASGPQRSPGRLGCRTTLNFSAAPDWRGGIKARYSSEGQLEEVYDRITVQSDSIVQMVQSWDLATPRRNRQWPGLPTFLLSIEQPGTRAR